MYRVQEFQSKANRLADVIPWFGLVHDNVAVNKDGSFMRCYALRGADVDSLGTDELLVYYERLNDLFKSQHLGSGWGIWTEATHRPAPPYPTCVSPFPVASLIDAERRAAFEETRAQHFDTLFYLTLLWLPPPYQANVFESYLFEDVAEAQSVNNASQLVAQFETATDHLAHVLGHILPVLRPLDEKETLTYLRETVSLKGRQEVRLPEIPAYLDVQLADMDAHFGVRLGLGNDPRDPLQPEYYIHTVSVRLFPQSIAPAMLAALDELPFPFRYVLRWLPLDKTEALKLLRTYEKRWFSLRKPIRTYVLEYLFKRADERSINKHAEDQAADIKEVITAVQRNDVSYGLCTATIAVWDKNPHVAAEHQAAVDGLLSALGFVCHRETLNAASAFLGMVPGNTVHNVRRPPMSSRNVARLMPLSAPWAGPERDEHLDGPPLLVGRTTGNQPFRDVLHVGGVGHRLILGPSGSGKTVYLNLMAIQFMHRYLGAQVFFLDKERGFQVLTQAMGGSYYILRSTADDTTLSFQPLGQLDVSDAERIWASEWIEQCMTLQRGTALQPHERAEVWRALAVLAAMPARQRTLTGFRAVLQDTALRQMITPYTVEGAYGSLFDAEKDTLTVGRWVGFEMADLLESPQAGSPALTYIFHRLRASFTGSPTLMIIDEGYRVLIDPQFTLRYQEALKEYRKLNVSVTFATQSIGDFLEHPIAPAILDNCLTRIYLPNAAALEPQAKSYYSRLGLSDAQIRQIAMATPREHYYYVSSQGNRLFSLDLGPVQQALLTASWKEDLRAADEIALLADEPFAVAWLRYRGLPWAADALIEAMHMSLSEVEG